MQTDPHKLDFRSDLLARLPGPGGLGPLGPIGGALPPTHDLTRPPTLFSATGYFPSLLSRRQALLFDSCCASLLSCLISHSFFFSFMASFSPPGPVNPPSAPFISPPTPHSSFLTPTAHLGKCTIKRHICASLQFSLPPKAYTNIYFMNHLGFNIEQLSKLRCIS